MQIITVWREGYSVSGNSDGAGIVGSVTASSLEEAIQYLSEDGNTGIEFRDDGTPHIWGMRLFDNEIDARKAFG